MTDEDNPLRGIDLSAWDAPAPPAGIADAAIARVRQSDVVVAPPRSRLKPILAVTTAVLAVAVAVLFVMVGFERAPVDGRGDVQAAVAQRLVLGATSASIEAGGELGWRRRGGRVDITQRRGAATWTVGGDDTLVIESGQPGAMGASIEAADASLRVEVRMLNRSDARVIGVGSAVAAAVAIVTVVVYEGHVKATHEGQSVTIAPGASVQFPAKVETPDSQFAVGGGPRAATDAPKLIEDVLLAAAITDRTGCGAIASDAQARTAFAAGDFAEASRLWREAFNCSQDSSVMPKLVVSACASKEIKPADKYAVAIVADTPAIASSVNRVCTGYGMTVDFTPRPKADAVMKCDEVSCTLNNFEGPCCANVKAMLDAKAQKASEQKASEQKASEKASEKNASEKKAPETKAPAKEEACDAAALKEKGQDYMSGGMDAAALATFERSLQCKEERGVVKLAYMAACRGKNQPKAKKYFAMIPERDQPALLQMCVRVGIDPE